MSARPAARIRAFAKINRSLRVLGTRPDGFHELRTVFQSIALHDTLTIHKVPGPFQLTCDDPACPTDDANLIRRAAERVWNAAGRRGAPRDVSIHLTKRIPLQAGLGGGSSDAAAALRVLGRLWRVDDVCARAIAPTLGADVPYFFEGGTVLGLDRGDLLFPLIDAPHAWVVLAVPSFGVSTKDAFAWFDEMRSGDHGPGTPGPRDRGNDLQPVVAKRYPEVVRLVGALGRAGAFEVAMSGSGSTVFGLFSSRRAAQTATVSLAKRGRRILITRTVDRAACQELAGR